MYHPHTFLDLNDDAIGHVFGFLDVMSLGEVCKVSKICNRLANEDHIWQAKYTEYLGKINHDVVQLGHWKQHFLQVWHSRAFNEARCNPDIKITNQGRTATVPKGANNTGYKGVLVDGCFSMVGISYCEADVEFLDTNDTSDHVSIGIANASFNTKSNCGEGWMDANCGAGWYSSNGAVYHMGSASKNTTEVSYNDKIFHKDKIGVMLDRNTGTVSFYKNDVLQKIAVISEKYKTEELFPAFILMHDVELTLRRIPPTGVRSKSSKQQSGCSVM